MADQVVITGVGIVSPLGLTAAAHYEAACAGRTGVRPVDRFDVTGLRTRIAGVVDKESFAEQLRGADSRLMDRFAQMAVVAAQEALEDAGIRPGDGSLDPGRLAVCVGTAQGGRVSDEELMESYFRLGRVRQAGAVPLIMPSAGASWVSIVCDARGPSFSISNACASGVQSLAQGARLLRSGACEAVLAGAADAPITRHLFSAWGTIRATSARNDDPSRASRPFDAGRDGFVLAEGAAVLLLERATRAMERGAPIYAEIVGSGDSSDACDIVAPDASGAGAVRAIRAALGDAGIEPDEVTLISAHGTSTRLNDAAEALALQSVFGVDGRAAVMSLKSMTGHAMGASGAIEVATLAMVLKNRVVPAHPNLTDADPACRLNHVSGQPGRYEGGFALANSFGFGGVNSCLVLAPWK